MAVGMVLLSHGNMAGGILDTLELIFGNSSNIRVGSLFAGQDIEQFKKQVLSEIEEADSGEGVLVFVDLFLFGASPYNVAVYAKKILEIEHKKVRIVSGMNLSMVLEVATMLSSSNLEELVSIAIAGGRAGIQEDIDIDDDENDEY